MSRVVLALCVLLWLPLAATAQCPGITAQVISFAKERLPISSVATPLTASIYKPSGVTPSMATVSVSGGAISYDVVGTPTAADGHAASGTFIICGYDNITAFRAIRVTTDAVLHVTYYKLK